MLGLHCWVGVAMGMLDDRGHKPTCHTIVEPCIKTCSKQFQVIVHTFVTLPKALQDFPHLPGLPPLVSIFTEQAFVLTYIGITNYYNHKSCQHIKLI